ncbi:hypothetical protein [Bradyrhizobium sp. S3.9.1]|uniref:hypothetical protein n=1 Tax=Bradyrhizobium sp. S3.9.1 TaxID=3156431 RepID=UPI0033907FEB
MSDEINATELPVTFHRIYAPLTWYWLAADGRIYSSARSMLVPDTDANYVEFCRGGPASEWPRDANGDQTDRALQDVYDALDVVGGTPPVITGTKSRYNDPDWPWPKWPKEPKE